MNYFVGGGCCEPCKFTLLSPLGGCKSGLTCRDGVCVGEGWVRGFLRATNHVIQVGLDAVGVGEYLAATKIGTATARYVHGFADLARTAIEASRNLERMERIFGLRIAQNISRFDIPEKLARILVKIENATVAVRRFYQKIDQAKESLWGLKVGEFRGECSPREYIKTFLLQYGSSCIVPM